MGRCHVFVLGVHAVAVAIAISACGGGGGGGDSNSAEAAVRRQFDFVDKGQWGRQWEELHPAQQAFVPRERFVECADERLSGMDIVSVKVLETFEEESLIPGTDMSVPSTALTVEVEFKQGLLHNKDTDTVHVFLVDGEWRWVTSDADAYKRGECPD
jgi:hypothetical protein